MYYAEEKKGFKPGWQSRKHQAAIQQDKERLENETKKASVSCAAYHTFQMSVT
jgi:hypothetical protein